ncbi:Guanine nucleotide-binding protein alpha-4 subunit [Grifola frondosa]|uniref:Guanine nucleotide-binding protein alpha-4 subunit n=1 Tax=Grifola frondosa TaxID=5627 RepID=A0A1C7LSH3_GRIFR|nr:Guanine nucleotide-binding protein alpha-4 subunit [Grifola frondosa]
MTPNVWPPYPPTDESEADKALRLEQEKEAKRVSDEIDRSIERERQELRKNHPQTKLLLLGQAESGKSTMLKNFQLYFAPSAFHAEAEAWRAVIHLNLVRYVNYVLSILASASTSSGAASTGSGSRATAKRSDSIGKEHRRFQMRLAPLRQVEVILSKCLAADSVQPSVPDGQPRNEKVPEVSIRSGSGWKSMARRRRGSQVRYSAQDELADARRILEACREDIVALWTSASVQAHLQKEGVDLEHHSKYYLDDAARVTTLSYMPTPEDILRARIRTIGVEEHRLVMETGQLLLHRDDSRSDIVPAAEKGAEWVFYDVGGHREQRAAWASYFEDGNEISCAFGHLLMCFLVNAMIFLCPMAAFDQVLSEDKTVNRLADSLTLWETICKSKSLANTTFILLLNKCDILHTKLKAGIRFAEYVPQYYDRPNKLENVTQCMFSPHTVTPHTHRDHLDLHDQMTATHQLYSPRNRQLHVHITCAIVRFMFTLLLSRILIPPQDTHVMSVVLKSIRDVILLNILQQTNLGTAPLQEVYTYV